MPINVIEDAAMRLPCAFALFSLLVLLMTAACAQQPARLTTLLAQLQEEDGDRRIDALTQLGALGDPRAVPDVLASTHSTNPLVRAKAAESLGMLAGEQAIPRLTEMLTDDFSLVHDSAITGLGNTRSPKAIAKLLLLANDTNSGGTSQAFTALCRLLHDLRNTPAVVQQLLPWALEYVRQGQLQGNWGYQNTLHEALQGTDDSPLIVNALGAILQDRASENRQLALDLIGYSSSPSVVTILLSLLYENDGNLAESAQRLLWEKYSMTVACNPSLLDPVRAKLEDADLVKAVRAAAVLGMLRDRPSVDALLGAVNKGGQLAVAASEALLRIRDARALPSLRALQTQDNADLRREAVAALVWAGDRDAFDALITLATDPSPAVREVLPAAFRSFTDPRSLDRILSLAKDADDGVRAAAVTVLAGYADQRATDCLCAALADRSARVQVAAIAGLRTNISPAVMPLLLRFLTLPATDERCLAAARVLAPTGNADAFTVLRNRHADVQGDQLIYILKQINSPLALRPLFELIGPKLAENPQNYWEADVTEMICGMGTPAFREIMRLLEDDQPAIRLAAVNACANLPDARFIPGLTPLVDDPDSKVRQLAIIALARTEDTRIVPVLTGLLDDPSPDVHFLVANALSRVIDETDAELLDTLLRDPDEGVVRTVIWSMPLAGEIPPMLGALLHDPRWLVRFAVVNRLAELRSDAAADLLAQALADSQREVRVDAAAGLKRIGTPHAIATLLANLVDASGMPQDLLSDVSDRQYLDRLLSLADAANAADLRAVALPALKNFYDGRIDPLVVSALADPNEDVQAAALRACGNRTRAGMYERIAPRLASASPAIKSAAIQAMGELHDSRAVPLLAKFLPTDYPLSLHAFTALATIGNQSALDALADQLPNNNTRGFYPKDILRELCNASDPRGKSLLLTFINTRFGPDAYTVLTDVNMRELFPVLLDMLAQQGYRDAHTTASLLEVIGRLGDARAVMPLLDGLQSGDVYSHAGAAEALGYLKDKTAVESLIAALNDPSHTDPGSGVGLSNSPYIVADFRKSTRQQAAWALGEIGDLRAVEPLIATLNRGLMFDRGAAAEALGKLKDPRAIKPLIAALPNLTGGARLAAATALHALTDQDFGPYPDKWLRWLNGQK